MLNLTSEGVMSEGVMSQGVAFEVCGAFRAAIDNDEPVCASCGHLADDHVVRSARVTRLPHRAVRRPTPARQAS